MLGGDRGGGARRSMLAWGWVERVIGSTIGAGGLVGGSEIWGEAAGSGRWHVVIAIGVTAMAGLALAATLVVSSRRGSLKSPWSRRKRKRALSRRMWNSFFSPDGKLRDGGVKFLKKARSGGIDPSIRADVWPFLLGVYELNSTEAERSCIERQKRAEYEMLRKRCRRLLNFHDKVNGLEGTGIISHKGSSMLKQEPESPASGDLSVRFPLAIGEGSGVDDQPGFDKPPNGNACYVEKLSGNADQLLNDGTPRSSTCKVVGGIGNKDQPVSDKVYNSCAPNFEDQHEFDKSPDGNACNAEEVCGNDDQPVYDRTPDSKTCKTGTGSSSHGQPVYDITPDSCAPNVEEDRIRTTLFDASDSSTCKIDGCSSRGQPIYDKTPNSYASNKEEDGSEITRTYGSDSSACKMDGGSSSQDHPVYDQTPDTCASKVEEDRSGIIHVDASAMETESSQSDSSGEEDDEGTLEPFTEGCLGPDPKYVKLASLKGDLSNRMAEDFATWQRIIRLDAVRANPEWVVYYPNQATVSEDKANESAIAVGLKDYDHLEPCMIYHAARLVAVLEAYALYDPEIGYCQGMSDLLSPIIAVIEEDHQAFWCFVGFMRKSRHNFRLDEVGIRRQLRIVAKIIKSKDLHLYRHLEKMQAEDCFFVYRMVVVLFRRELGFEQTVCLWEVMWADQAAIRAGIGKSGWGRIRLRAPPTDDLLLYAIAACVLQRRKLIIEKYCSMDEILRECNNMAGQLDVWRLLDDAHDLVVTLHDKI